MRARQTITIDWEAMGALFALCDERDQAAFFDGFAHELSSDSYESHFTRETQMVMMINRVKEATRKCMEEYLVWTR